MKKISVVICDIIGTFLNSTDSTRRKEYIEEFVLNLKILKELHNDDEIVLSFITSEGKELCDKVEDIVKNTSNPPTLGTSLYHNGSQNNEKSNDRFVNMVNYLQALSANYNVSNIYFIDDQSINIILGDYYFKNAGLFNASCILARDDNNNGLQVVNEKLTNYINSIKKVL